VKTIIRADAAFLDPRWRAHPELTKPEAYTPQGVQSRVRRPNIFTVSSFFRFVSNFIQTAAAV
jgi:hypothetical protein